MIKYYYLNKEHAMLGEVVVRKVSIVPMTKQALDNEFGDNNWVEYQHEGDNLPPYLKYDNNTRTWSTDPPAGYLTKHMYMGMDALEGIYHEGNLDLSKIGSKPYFNNTIESYAEMALSYPWQSYITTYDSKNKPVNMMYIGKDNDRLKVADDSHELEMLRNLYVKGQIFTTNTINSYSDVEATLHKKDGTQETVSLLKLKAAFDTLSEQVKDLLEGRSADTTPVGVIATFPNYDHIPLDYLICDGSAFDTSAYPDLYKVLGTNRVPDMRGMFQRMLDLGRGVDHDPGRGPLSLQGDHVSAGNAYNIGVVYAIKSTILTRKTNAADNAAQTLRILVNLINKKYDKSGGPISGSMNVTGNLNAGGEIRGVGSFANFNDMSEYVNTEHKYDKLILSLYDPENEIYKPCFADDAIFTIGISVAEEDTGMIIGQPKNENESLVALKGRVYVKCALEIKKGSKVYLSNIIPGHASDVPNDHFVGYAVTDSKDGLVRVLVKS